MPQLILADKSDLFRRSISSVLQREGYEVSTAETGAKVLALLQEIKPAAIILDTETPDPSGLETLLLVKRDPALRRLPVILVSRDSAPSAVSNAYKVGAEGFMLKPIDLNQLVKLLAQIQTPLPRLAEPLEIVLGARTVPGTLRFIDQHGTLYVDKLPPSELEAAAAGVWDPLEGEAKAAATPLGTVGVLAFTTEAGKEVRQRVLLSEENEQGLALFPAGDPTPNDPTLLKVPVNYQSRYRLPGGFMKLSEVTVLTGAGLTVSGLAEEPPFNAEIHLTVYPPSGGQEGGIPLTGQVSGVRSVGGTFEADVLLTGAPGPAFVGLFAEAATGKPDRAAPSAAPSEASV